MEFRNCFLKQNFQVIVFLFLTTILFSVSVGAYFIPAGLGVRPAALGGAFVAVADDANAVLFNPAGYAGLEKIEMVSMYSELYAGLNARLFTGELDRTGYNFLSVALPFGPEIGTVGLAWIQLDSLIYTENVYALSYGRTLPLVPIDLGITLKVLQWQVAQNEFTTQNSFYPYSQFGKTGVTADIGVKYKLDKNLTIAASVENSIPVDMGITRTEIVPMVVRAGAAYHLVLENRYIDHLLVAGEIDLREDATDEILNPRLGLESTHLDLFALRVGTTFNEVSAGLGIYYQVPQTPLGVQLDYAFTYPFEMSGTGGSHRIGLKGQWDHQATPILSKQLKEEQPGTYRKETAVPGDAGATGPVFGPMPLAPVLPVPAVVPPTRQEAPLGSVIPDKYPKKIVIGIDQILSNQKAAEMKSDLAYILAYLNEKISIKIEQRRLTIDDLKKQFLLGELDMVVSYNEYFYEFYQNGLIRPAIVIRSQGKPYFLYYLYVSQDSTVVNKKQLKGKRLGYLGGEKRKYLKTIMYDNIPEFNAAGYFDKIVAYSTPMEAVLALQMGTVDALLGMDREYQLDAGDSQAQGVKIHGGLKIIAQSPPIPNSPVWIKWTGNEKKQAGLRRIVELMLLAHQTKRVRDILNKLGIDRLISFDEKKYHHYLGGR